MLVGLPGFGLGTLFYGVLLLGMGGAKLWCAVSQLSSRMKGLWRHGTFGSASPVRLPRPREDELTSLP
jgi:hypothetical protein